MNNDFKCFLAANSGQGFVSYFDKCYDASSGWRAYIIKGGPGTGKSSFMKYILNRAKKLGKSAVAVPCSSDPYSLDAIILTDIKTVIMDGTSPHTVDPKYPAVCEQLLDFGRFWKPERFNGKEERIITLTDKNKLHHKRASRYLQAAGQFLVDNFKIADLYTEKERLTAFAKRLCRRRIPPKPKTNAPKEQICFLSGITPEGIICFADILLSGAKKSVIITDEFGSAANTILTAIRDYSLENGYSIITVKNPFLPHITDGIIIPETDTFFIRESELIKFDSDIRRINTRRFIAPEQLAKNRQRIKFNKKTAERLISAAVDCLKDAKTVHDELEKEYINAMDFEKLNAFAENFAQKLF